MASSFEHRALVEQLRALTSKRAENPGEQILNTSHPSGSNSSADDHTQPAVVGHRYAENSADNKAMHPKGTDSGNKNQPGSEEKDPGNNKGLHPRASGDAPEVERKYNLNEHNDPGTSHPSGKAAQAFINEARSLAAELRNLVKASADSYVTGEVAEEATDDTKTNAKGTSAYPVNAENDGNISIPADKGKNAAAKIAALRNEAIREMRGMYEHMKESAQQDAASFVDTVTAIMDKFAAPYVIPVIEQSQKQAQEIAVVAAIEDFEQKVAEYDAIASQAGLPKYAEMMDGAEKKKPDADGDGVPDWADKKEGPDMEKKEAAKLAAILAKAAEMCASDMSDDSEEESVPAKKQEKKEAASRKGRTFRKSSEEEVEDEGEEASPEDMDEVSDDEEMAAEEVLADMAAMPAAPDMAGDPAMMDPGMGGEAPLGPEEEAALMALMEQEGLKASDVKAYAKISAAIASGRLKTEKLSQAQHAFVSTCDAAVKKAGAKFQTLRSAAKLRNEINSIYRGIR
jgi:hypothetical protein